MSLLKIEPSIEEAYTTLEKYYNELHNYSQNSNWSNYDIDVAYRKNSIEKVLFHRFKLTNEDKNILSELLTDDNIDVILSDAIKRILNSERLKNK